MRNLLTKAIASIAFATAAVGSASAATDLPRVDNPALYDQLERDATNLPLRQGALASAVSHSDQTTVTSGQAQVGQVR